MGMYRSTLGENNPYSSLITLGVIDVITPYIQRMGDNGTIVAKEAVNGKDAVYQQCKTMLVFANGDVGSMEIDSNVGMCYVRMLTVSDDHVTYKDDASLMDMSLSGKVKPYGDLWATIDKWNAMVSKHSEETTSKPIVGCWQF